MSNEMVKARGTALPSVLVNKLAASLSRTYIRSASGGTSLLRLLTSGVWVYGQANTPVKDDTLWIANIETFRHGLVCWAEGKLADEVMVPMGEDIPDRPDVHASGQPYKTQYSVELKGLTGGDKDVEVLYKTSSMGGEDAMAWLKDTVVHRMQSVEPDNPFLFPVLEFGVGSYPNKTHGGTTYKPDLELVGWADVNGELEEELEPVAPPEPPKPEPKPAVQARRRPGR